MKTRLEPAEPAPPGEDCASIGQKPKGKRRNQGREALNPNAIEAMEWNRARQENAYNDLAGQAGTNTRRHTP